MTIVVNAGFRRRIPNVKKKTFEWRNVRNLHFYVDKWEDITPAMVRAHGLALPESEGWRLEGYAFVRQFEEVKP